MGAEHMEQWPTAVWYRCVICDHIRYPSEPATLEDAAAGTHGPLHCGYGMMTERHPIVKEQ